MAEAKLYRIVDQQGRTYFSNQFKGYYDSKERAQRALRHLPTKVYVGWSEQTKRPLYEDARYEVQESETTWRTVL